MYRKSNLKIVLDLLIVLSVCFSVGYAYLNTSLTINGTSTVQKNTWDTHFDNINIKEGSVVANVEPTVESGTKISRFDLVLQKPGDFYEFTVDVVNGGTLDAMVSNIVKTPNLTAAQQKYLDYKIEYENGEEITKKQLVKVEEFVRVKVRVEYKKDLNVADLPTELDLVSLGFEINYEQADESAVSISNNGVKQLYRIISGDFDTVGSEICIDTECFYVISSNENSVTMLSKYNLYVGNVCIDNSSCTAYGEEATGIQDSSMIGRPSNLGYPRYGTIEFGPSIYYSESIVKVHVDNYSDYLVSLNAVLEEVRLLTMEEAVNLGCSSTDYSCSSAIASWVYSTSYWTMTEVSGNLVWRITSDCVLGCNMNNEANLAGIRPVIVISKSEI